MLVDLIYLLKMKYDKIIVLLTILLFLLFLVVSRINKLTLFSRMPKLLTAFYLYLWH